MPRAISFVLQPQMLTGVTVGAVGGATDPHLPNFLSAELHLLREKLVRYIDK